MTKYDCTFGYYIITLVIPTRMTCHSSRQPLVIWFSQQTSILLSLSWPCPDIISDISHLSPNRIGTRRIRGGGGSLWKISFAMLHKDIGALFSVLFGFSTSHFPWFCNEWSNLIILEHICSLVSIQSVTDCNQNHHHNLFPQ